MARGSSNTDNLDLYFMSIRGLKKGESVHIKQTKAGKEKGQYEELENINSVSGKLVKIETKTRVHEGESYEEIRLWLKDTLAGEMYVLSCGLNNMGRSLINLLAGVEGTIGTLDIRVYTNKTSNMPSIYIENNGQKVSWKYDYKEVLAPMVEYTLKKKKNAQGVVEEVKEPNYLTLNEFLLKVFREEVYHKVDKKEEIKTQPTAQVEVFEEVSEGQPDDLPF